MYVNDLSFFHQPNCGMPANALIIFAGVFSVFWLITGFLLIVNIWQMQNKSIMKLLLETMMYHIFLEVTAIGLAIQNGMIGRIVRHDDFHVSSDCSNGDAHVYFP